MCLNRTVIISFGIAFFTISGHSTKMRLRLFFTISLHPKCASSSRPESRYASICIKWSNRFAVKFFAGILYTRSNTKSRTHHGFPNVHRFRARLCKSCLPSAKISGKSDHHGTATLARNYHFLQNCLATSAVSLRFPVLIFIVPLVYTKISSTALATTKRTIVMRRQLAYIFVL